MLDFYKTALELRYLNETDIHDAAYWGVISLTDYKTITGKDYVA